MQKLRCIPQEVLKLIACITMLIDHIGAALLPELRFLRIIGRLAFPIYCFLLAEGMRRTRSPYKYLLRLFIGILLAELPFDYLFFGGFTWEHQSVMVTLFLGGTMLLCMTKTGNIGFKLFLTLPFAFLAEICCCDYGGYGILLMAVFGIVPSFPGQLACVLLLSLAKDGEYIANSLVYFPGWPREDAIGYILSVQPPIQSLCTFAMVPIGLYSGQKLTHSRLAQTVFYLFYPLHLAALWIFANYLL